MAGNISKYNGIRLLCANNGIETTAQLRAIRIEFPLRPFRRLLVTNQNIGQ